MVLESRPNNIHVQTIMSKAYAMKIEMMSQRKTRTKTYQIDHDFASFSWKASERQVQERPYEGPWDFGKDEVNISLLDTMINVPRSAKLLKEFCTKKNPIHSDKVSMEENASSLI